MRSPSRIAAFALVASFTAGAFLIAPGAALAAGPAAWDQSDLTLGSIDMGSAVTAVDFTLAEPTRISAVTLWIADDAAGDDGLFGSFSGTLSWAVFAHDVDAPGSLVRSGAARAVEVRDFGIQSNLGTDLFTVRFELDHPIVVPAGTWWLGVREGEWGAADDGSQIWWQATSTFHGDFPLSRSSDLVTPGDWVPYVVDAAFVLTAEPFVWEQSELQDEPGDWWFLSSHVTAIDFQLAAAESFSSVDAWLVDETEGDDDGLLDTFSGLASWAVYADAAGKPGAELASGDGIVHEQVDAGVQAAFGGDVARVRIALGRTIGLAPGTYWLALHEGAWLSAGDGSIVGWHAVAAKQLAGIWQDTNPAAPGTWTLSSPNEDLAVVIGDDTIFASGFEAGVTCAWTSSADPCY